MPPPTNVEALGNLVDLAKCLVSEVLPGKTSMDSWHSLIIAEQTQHNLLLTGFAISVVTECPEVIVRAFQVGARHKE